MNIVLCGTSGVGKTFFEEYLEKSGISWQLPKYFDRENRPNERKDKNISLSHEEWTKLKNDFFFTLSYNNYNYGWKKTDFRDNAINTLAITLDSLASFTAMNKDFIPILLWIDRNCLDLLRKRMKARGENDDKINQRIALAESEIEKEKEYKKIVTENHGWIVTIKDDSSIFEELLPKIKTLL